MSKIFALPNTTMPTSFDPLELDNFHNYFSGQMLYLAPIQINSRGALYSILLEKFVYDSRYKQLALRLREGLKFSNGSPIYARDITLAILRMAKVRPDFAFIPDIIGIEEWSFAGASLKFLPQGIQVKGRDITIRLGCARKNPLYCLALNVFAVVPLESCHLETSHLNCRIPPSSGPYIMAKRGEDFIEFTKNPFFPLAHYPQQIKFDYPKLGYNQYLLEHCVDEAVLFSHEMALNKALINSDDLASFHIDSLPKSWFSAFILNATRQPFDDPLCRQWFRDVFYSEFCSQKHINIVSTQNLFPGSLMGSGQASKRDSYNELEVSTFVKQINRKGLNLIYRNADLLFPIGEVLVSMAKKYNLKLNKPIKDLHGDFREWDLQPFNSGFSLLDPIADIKILFTKGVHSALQGVVYDKVVADLANSFGPSRHRNRDIVHSLNKKLYQDAILNSYCHWSYIYMRLKKYRKLAYISDAVSMPYPWEVFNDPGTGR